MDFKLQETTPSLYHKIKPTYQRDWKVGWCQMPSTLLESWQRKHDHEALQL